MRHDCAELGRQCFCLLAGRANVAHVPSIVSVVCYDTDPVRLVVDGEAHVFGLDWCGGESHENGAVPHHGWREGVGGGDFSNEIDGKGHLVIAYPWAEQVRKGEPFFVPLCPLGLHEDPRHGSLLGGCLPCNIHESGQGQWLEIVGVVV